MLKLFLIATIFAINSQLALCPVSRLLNDLAPVNFLPISTPGTPPITAFVKQIPNLFGLCFAIKTVPHRVTLRIKEFLEELVTEIPDDNILRFHFNNILLLLSTYKNIIDAKKDAFRRFTDVIEDLETNQLPTMFQNRHIDDDIPDDKPSLPNLPKRLGFLSPLNGTPFTPFMQKPFFGGEMDKSALQRGILSIFSKII